ncbi:MAG TPA: TonB-dependent receptor [Thermoanaerobaculia bacterium]|nr:TonB-dependent receptor [Thermoanaerobaculia bacterium]
MRRFTVLLAVFALLAVPMFGATTGTIAVTATDSTGAVLPGVTIEATSPVQIGTRTAVTDSRGQAILAGMVPGRYTIKGSLSGFQPTSTQATVEQNTTATLVVKMNTEAVTESITVTAEAPMVDTTRATVSEHVTLQEVEALPVGRDYKAYAQLVPGVNVVPNQGGSDTPVDPAGKGGNNYSDRGVERGFGKTGSTDNTYYIDGLNVTDMGNGRGTMTFNNEVILEQEIVTSGVPAEYAGGKGYVGSVVTKSGGNEFSGSLNYYLQNANMYEDYKTDRDWLWNAKEEKYDAAITLGGPIVRDRAWFFASGQLRKNTDEVAVAADASPSPLTTEWLNDRQNYFGKLTLKATDATTIIGQYFSDPRDQDADVNRNASTVPGRYIGIEDTPRTITGSIQHLFGSSVVVEGRYGQFEEEYHQFPLHPELGQQNTLRLAALSAPACASNPSSARCAQLPNYSRNLGGASTFFDQLQKRDQADLNGSLFFNAAGTHTLKGGYQYTKLQDQTSSRFNGGATMTSLASVFSGVTLGELAGPARGGIYSIFSNSEFDNARNALRNASPTSAAFRAADTNGDNTISDAEFAAIRLSNSANNPGGGINFLRTANQSVGTNNVVARANTAFLQDDWNMGQWTVNAGVRMEDWKYIASDNSTILDMDPTFSPRLGLTWDVGGQGRQKLTAFYGRYYDPIRTDMVHFAGNITGTVNAEQLFIGNDWFTYRLRGSATVRDAGFAPNLKNQTQDEYSLTYGINLTPTWAFMAQAFRRIDDNLIEDYDPHVYWELPGYACPPSGCTPTSIPAEYRPFLLTPGQHGWPPTGIDGPVNFYLANAIGAERQTDGLDLAFERRFSGNWTANIQYMWRNAEGNITSDANADLVGDAIEYDPRQPYMYGKLQGTADHQFKLYGMYRLPFNLEVGALAYWNSGAHYTESEIFLPGQYDIYLPLHREDGTFAERGVETHPSYYTVDAKLRYLMPVRRFNVDLFLDIYNLTNNQDAIFVTQAHNDPDSRFTYQSDRVLLSPRRYQAGVRLRF